MVDLQQRLILRWDELPTRPVRSARRARGERSSFAGQPWIDTGPRDRPLDFSFHLSRLVTDLVRHTDELKGIQVPRILFGFTQARHLGRHGLQARVTPLRFPHGHIQRQRRGVLYQVQRFFKSDHEYLYLMTFCLPRFLDQDFDDKLVTIFHELFHIGPKFDGDLRRHEGRYHLHTHSQHGYDQTMAEHARAYMRRNPDPVLHAFLRLNFAQLRQRHGEVVGVVVPRPKLIPVSTASTMMASRSILP